MPITTFQNILSTDKLQSGFRAKFNSNVALLITDIVDLGDGTMRVDLQGGTNFIVDLGTSFYTKAEVVSLLAAVTTVAWGSITGDVAYQTDVVGNFGVLTDIDDILLSCNFAVDAADADNPFFGSPASGYASFSVPGIAGTGWQLLTKEANGSEIKYRSYYDGAWHGWASIQAGSEVEYPAATALPLTLVNGDDFSTGKTTPVVGIAVKDSSTSKTTNGAVYVVKYNYTDSSMDTLLNIVILDNGTGSLEFDTTFTIV